MSQQRKKKSIKRVKKEVERRLTPLLFYVDPSFMNECIDSATRAILEGRTDDMDAAINKLANEATRRAKERGYLK